MAEAADRLDGPRIVTSKSADPEWLAHRYDPAADTVHLRQTPRNARQAQPFLTDEYLGAAAIEIAPRRVVSDDRTGQEAPVHFIFHSAFCCSTLLASALDIPGVASSFKEPVILNDIVGWLHRGGDRGRIGEVLSGVTNLLNPFEPHEAVVIKPSNVVNGLAHALLMQRPASRAILMYTSLEQYLASIARKGMWSRVWVRDLLSKQLLENFVHLGFEARDYLLQTDLQVAAIGWLAQQALFVNLLRKWPDRVRALNGDELVAAPAQKLDAAGSFFGLSISDVQRDHVLKSVFSRNTKDGAPFAPGQRKAEAQAGYEAHRDEIEKVLIWAAEIARLNSIPLTLDSRL